MEAEKVARAIANIDFGEVGRQEAGLERVGISRSSKEFSANRICGRCQSAFYCTKKCQKERVEARRRMPRDKNRLVAKGGREMDSYHIDG